jgi:hypothetical protein
MLAGMVLYAVWFERSGSRTRREPAEYQDA